MYKNIIFNLFLLLISLPAFSATVPPAVTCQPENQTNFSDAIPCYRQNLAATPLNYTLISSQAYGDVQVNRYQLQSQSWSPSGLVLPAQWGENIAIAIPANPKPLRALIAADINEDLLYNVAEATRTIAISIISIPSTNLIYANDGIPRNEDDSVSRSWRLFLDNPSQRQLLPLHVPMATTISQTIRLAKTELQGLGITQFIVTGASKRGWSSWLTAISDPNVVAVVPMVSDVLNTQQIMQHMYQTYGGNWPIAFQDYYNQNLDTLRTSANFTKLMKIEDPLQYLGTRYQTGLSIPKYIINASGDDFFIPDNTRYFYDQLPGEKSLRIAPNTDHAGIINFAQQSLITFVNRIQNGTALPVLTTTYTGAVNNKQMTINFSEKPSQVVRWTATNTASRDFRYACGIRYVSSPLPLSGANTVTISLANTNPGWQASFIEATFSDGYVATSQVNIVPDAVYPTVAPPSDGAACQTLPSR